MPINGFDFNRSSKTEHRSSRLVFVVVLLLAACQSRSVTPTPWTPTVPPPTPTPVAATPTPGERPVFLTYAQGELLPDMRMPVQRGIAGEGGWYVVIGSKEGWAQFLSHLGQPGEIWEAVEWEQEILIGALLGLQQGHQYGVAIAGLDMNAVEIQPTIVTATLPFDKQSADWITYPFHLIRVSRAELPAGMVNLRFVDPAGQELAAQVIDAGKTDIAWLSGPGAAYPTPTPVIVAPTPQPTPTSTPVPNLQVKGMILNVNTSERTLRIVAESGNWAYVNLMDGTSLLLTDGQPTTLAQLAPGMIIGVLGYAGEKDAIRAAHVDILKLPTEDLGFAAYQSRGITISTIYSGYTLPLVFENIQSSSELTATLGLSGVEALAHNGFVIAPTNAGVTQSAANFTSLYNDPLYATYPVFISADSVLHVSQLLFDRLQRTVVQTHLWPELTALDREMFALSWAQYEATSPGMPMRDAAAAAWRNAVYFAVALALLDPAFTPPDEIAPTVNAELSLISAAKSITISPLLNNPAITDTSQITIDYTRFASDPLDTGGEAVHQGQSRYAQAMTWHRAVPWRWSSPPRIEQRTEALAAALIAQALSTYSAPRVLWQRLYATISFLDGQSATLTPADCSPLVDETWASSAAANNAANNLELEALTDDARLDAFIQAVYALPQPINRLQTKTWPSKGRTEVSLTFLGQPFQSGQYILQRTVGDGLLVEADVSLPVPINLAAALGSADAYYIAGESGYGKYASYVDQIRIELGVLPDSAWTADLQWNWLYTCRILVRERGVSYPQWMRTLAWRRHELQTMLGTWTDIQSTVPLSAEFVLMSDQDGAAAPWGYVEPQPQLYGHLAALTQMMIDGFKSRLMLSGSSESASAEETLLSEWHTWLLLLQDMARRELTGQTITDLEYQRLTDYGRVIAGLTTWALDDQVGAEALAVQAGTEQFAAYDMAAVARVAGSDKEALFTAIGRADEIYVVVERGQQLYLTRGGVYSYYELSRPSQSPLTGALWRQMLQTESIIPRPSWVAEE